MKRRRRRKRYIRTFLRFLILALILGAVFVCLTMFTLSDLTVTGNYHESSEDVAALVQKGPLKNNSLFLSLFYRDREIKGNTFIDTVDISYVKHDAVSVRVREKNLVGYVEYNDRYWYFDREGKVLVMSPYNESEYKALARGEKLPDPTGTESDLSVAPEDMPKETAGKNAAQAGDVSDEIDISGGQALYHMPTVYLTDDEEYVEEYTADYDDGEYSEDYDADTGEEEYDEGYDGEEYDGTVYDEEDDGNESEEYDDDDGEDEVIPIKPELIDDVTPSPIPADESSVAQVTPIPAEEVLVKEYKSEDTFAENYIPEITGLRFTEAVLGERLPARYASIYSALDALKTYAETNGIYPTSVDISSTGNLQIHFNDVTVNLGTGEHIERRLAVLGQILPELLGRSGTMHLENYDGTESRLIFSKSKKNS